MLAAKEAPKLVSKGMRIRYKGAEFTEIYFTLLIDVIRGARKANGN